MSDGLEGVVAADTVLSEVDGQAGRLIIRGRSLDELAGRTTFEEVTRLLWDGFFDGLPDDLPPALGRGSDEVEVFDEGLGARHRNLLDRTPIEAMRALTARLADGDELNVALRLVAAPSVFTAAVVRAQAGEAPVRPDLALGHAADTLRMLRGKPASRAEVDALDTYLVTVSDHGLNASTFAARVIASTRAGLTSAVLGGISALKGPLHGGAPGPIIEMLDAIGRPENAQAWIEAALARGDRLMGFGHRVYRVRDPRADALKAAVRRLMSESSGTPEARRAAWPSPKRSKASVLAIPEAAKKPDRRLDNNVEFYTALLLPGGAGLPAPRPSPASSRPAGVAGSGSAHAREQLAGGRLIRPQSRHAWLMPRRALGASHRRLFPVRGDGS